MTDGPAGHGQISHGQISHGQISHVLLDFFGTLADYSASRTEQGYHASYRLVADAGARLSYAGFLDAWSAESAWFDERSARDDSEFSMREVGAAFLARVLGHDPGQALTRAFVTAYLAEWNTGVSYPPGMTELIAGLAADYRLAVVTNTHDADLVPAHLGAMGIASYVDTVVTSVEVGWRKPHPAIYAEALSRLRISPDAAVFAGDTYAADYAGPAAAGIAAFLIDPDARFDIPGDRRLRTLADLPSRLAAAR